MPDTSDNPLRVTLITGSGGLDHALQQFLQHNGVQVVNDHALEDIFLSDVDTDGTDVLLVDLEDPLDAHLNRLDGLIGRSQVPILFNAARGVPNGTAGDSLLAKLAHLAKNPASMRRAELSRIPAPVEAPASTPVSSPNNVPDNSPTNSPDKSSDIASLIPAKPRLRVVKRRSRAELQRADRVWVLGASLGGPSAVSRFLQALPPQLPLTFVYVQHISEEFVGTLARQIDNISSIPVVPASDGTLLCKGQMIIAPVGQLLTINESGVIGVQAQTEKTTYNPSIDNVMCEVAHRYGRKAGAIIFSGMGDDGVRGAREVLRGGGTVWAQDTESCQTSTMPDAARRQGVVSFSGSPEDLAARIASMEAEARLN